MSVSGTAQISIRTQDKSARRIQADKKGKDLTSSHNRWGGTRRASDSSSQCSCFLGSLLQGRRCTVAELTLHTTDCTQTLHTLASPQGSGEAAEPADAISTWTQSGTPGRVYDLGIGHGKITS